MGFSLWIDGDVAWASGTQEYRAMGTAVIAATDLFGPRDFRPRNRAPHSSPLRFAGMFASLGQINGYLLQLRRRASASHRRKQSRRRKDS